jgi:hypothetical protein
VQVSAEPPPLVPEPQAALAATTATATSSGEASRIEITLPDGTMVRVGEEIGAVALRRVLMVLRG